MTIRGVVACAVLAVCALTLAVLVVGMTGAEVLLLQYLGWNVPTQVYGILVTFNILLVVMALCWITDISVTL